MPRSRAVRGASLSISKIGSFHQDLHSERGYTALVAGVPSALATGDQIMKTVILVLPLLAAFAAPIAASSHGNYDLTLPGIQLRPGVTVDLHAAVFVDDSHPCNGNVALAIHGLMHTAATWSRMVTSLFDDNPAGRKFCRVVALDMPGRGGSGVPANLWFGEVTPGDYVSAILGALDQLRALHIQVDTVFAHSAGGLLVQMAQQRLLARGTDLRNAYGVKDAVLLASATPKQIPVYSIDSGMLTQIMMSFAQVNPIAGTAGIPDSVWAWMFFAPDPTNPSIVVPGAPPLAEVTANHYNASEPLAFIGALTNRAPIDAGVFAPAHKTALTVVSYEKDITIRPDESRALYTYLTGDETGERVVLVPGYEALHDTHISNPALLLQSIAAVVRMP
jgi:pimeloyl-ACP methyl ester carboxylesterase